MNDRTEIRAWLMQLFARTLNVDVSEDTDLFDSGSLDSLAFVELLLQLERAFGIVTSVDDLEPDNFRTIGCITDFIVGRLESAREGPAWTALRAKAG
jgi:acyl carrier protein